MPQPKQLDYTDDHLRVDPADRATPAIHVADEAATAAAIELQRSLATRPGFELPVVSDTPGAAIRLEHSRAPLPAEGYTLVVDRAAATVTAATAAGFLHGVQTLKQLRAPNSDATLRFHGATIRDWPSLRYRGVHLFTGGRGPELHIRLLQDLLAPLKFNHVVLESEYVRWDACPAIHHPVYGMSKNNVREILTIARSLGITVTPLVMSLGHCEWMFHNDQNLDLAEDPDAKWAYCVTNPRTREFIERIYAEAIELFEPQMFHIGHDEFTDRGRVPHRATSRSYTPSELFQMDTLAHHAWFATRGVRMMMWGDMLLGPGEGPDACHAESVADARALRDTLPRDILIADWHYVDATAERFSSLDVLHTAGFETVAATWHSPTNIMGFAHAAHARGARGLLQTTWAGFSLDADSFAREARQYAAHIVAGDAAWNADRPIRPAVAAPRYCRFAAVTGWDALHDHCVALHSES